MEINSTRTGFSFLRFVEFRWQPKNQLRVVYLAARLSSKANDRLDQQGCGYQSGDVAGWCMHGGGMINSRNNRLSVHFRSGSDDWATPQDLYDDLNKEFHFTTDVCASEHNAKCDHYFSAGQNGLNQTWEGVCWMNPPYGRQISKWVHKAYQSSLNGATVVCLLPARTDTRWWNQFCVRGEIRFLQGRLKFCHAKQSAPFPSAIVIFRPPVKSRFRWTTMMAVPQDGGDHQ